MKYISLFAASVAALALCSCANEEYEGQSSGEQVRKVNFTVADFQWEDATDAGRGAMKTQAVKSGDRINFLWSETDTVGIYPNKGHQVDFPIEEGTGEASATFDGGGWALKTGSTYMAYYPYNRFNFDKSRITLRYGVQTQVGNDNVDNLAKYDYIVSSMAVPESGELTFQFQHLGCLVRFQFTVPEADNLTKFTLISTEDVFPTEQNLNLSTGEPVVTTTSSGKSISMDLSNMSVSAGQTVTLYVLTPAINLTGKDLIAKLRGSHTYTADFKGKNHQMGMALSYSSAMANLGGHEYVDLGLSVKWATCNVGATTPEDYGDYFAWGATEPFYIAGQAQSSTPMWKYGKSGGYNWVNTPYQTANTTSDSSTKFLKYLGSTSSSYKDASATDANALKTTLDPEDDAATVNWGSGWRMPTRSEQDELLNTDNCTWTWTSVNGIDGYRVTSKKAGYTDRSIFLPAAGYRGGTSLYGVGSGGSYWSGSLYASAPYNAYGLGFDYSSNFFRGSGYRYYGFSVRPVCQ